ncbi:MAG: GNAT family N-acetyltransferase [Bacteroidales bacterium]|nr:GNAT family N-acetyltransferase [Bacteroidales bacterium]MBN2817508.1 GNAT family N-acetyltransferase [Bacteroidales bacterium]
MSLSVGIDVHRKSAEVGYLISEPYWNKGIATKVVKLIVDYGLKKLGLNRIYTGILAIVMTPGSGITSFNILMLWPMLKATLYLA